MILLTERSPRRTIAMAAEQIATVDVYDRSISGGGGAILRLVDGQQRIVEEDQDTVLALINLALTSTTYPISPSPPPEGE
jgi:hypothetical protein